jgi:hypothetical protein
MVLQTTTLAYLSYLLGTSISLIFGILLILTHLAIPRLIKHPGSFILAHCITHLFVDLHWYTGIPSVRSYFISTGSCYYIAVISILGYLLAWGYMSVLSLEIMFKILYPASTIYKRRIILLHALVWLAAIPFLIFVITVGKPGRSVMNTCFILADSEAEYFFLAPAGFYSPIIFISLIVTKLRTYKSGKSMLRNHTLVVIMFWITMIPSVLSHFLRNVEEISFGLTQYAIASGSLSGFFISVARLANRRLMRECYYVICKRRLKSRQPLLNQARGMHLDCFRMPLTELDTSVSEDSMYYADIYENITISVRTN